MKADYEMWTVVMWYVTVIFIVRWSLTFWLILYVHFMSTHCGTVLSDMALYKICNYYLLLLVVVLVLYVKTKCASFQCTLGFHINWHKTIELKVSGWHGWKDYADSIFLSHWPWLFESYIQREKHWIANDHPQISRYLTQVNWH